MSDPLQKPPRFLSLRWKSAFVFLLLLLTILSALSWRFYLHLENQLRQQLDSAHQDHQLLIDNLLDDSANTLVNLAETVFPAKEHLLSDADHDSVPEKNTAQQQKQPLTNTHLLQHYQQNLEANWQQLNLAWNIESVLLFDRFNQLNYQTGKAIDNKLAGQWAKQVNITEEPLVSITCKNTCSQYAAIPLLNKGKRIGVMVMGASLSDVIIAFQQIANVSLGIVNFAPDTTAKTDIPAWGANIIALNTQNNSRDILQAAAESSPGKQYFQSAITVDHQQNTYAISLLPVKDKQTRNIQFALIDNISAARSNITDGMRETIILSIGGLLAFTLCLTLLMWRHISRIKLQSELLPLLGQKQFQQARGLLVQQQVPSTFHDELDILEDASTTLSFQLESLEKAVELRTSEMERLSLFDSLTGLANRNLFQYEVQRESQRFQQGGETLAVILLDLDKFKRVNDSLGHQLGDMLLGKIADRLKHAARTLGVVSRLGGDEFAIMVRNVKRPAQIEVLCQKVSELIKKPIQLNKNTLVVSASIGAAIAMKAQSANDVVKHAEIAMYKAKGRGGDTFQLFDSAMEAETRNTLSLESEIRRGFDNNEYTLYLQPKVNMDSQTEGFESLIRWDHPDRGIVPPIEFIPIIEEMGLISRLDNLVLEASCRQLNVWKDLYPNISIAVNISSTHFTDRNFLVFLQKCLSKYSIDPNKLELEITETLLMENMSVGLEVINHIKALGVRIAIDDFGTGYSSLSYLKRLPVDTLKIDREFIKDIPESASDMQISSVIIFLAKQLGFKVVAEGVETSEQLVFLKANQCDLCQGFYFSKPIPAHKAMILLESERLSN